MLHGYGTKASTKLTAARVDGNSSIAMRASSRAAGIGASVSNVSCGLRAVVDWLGSDGSFVRPTDLHVSRIRFKAVAINSMSNWPRTEKFSNPPRTLMQAGPSGCVLSETA